MFGISFWELLLIGTVALLVVGPDKLPQMLGTLGRWSNKLRRITTEVRYQTGIDDLLRQQGIQGGLDEIRELRNMVKGNVAGLAANVATQPKSSSARTTSAPSASGQTGTSSAASSNSTASASVPLDPFKDIQSDPTREYPPEGCDAGGCLPDGLWWTGESADYEQEALDWEAKNEAEKRDPDAAGDADSAADEIAETSSSASGSAASEDSASEDSASESTVTVSDQTNEPDNNNPASVAGKEAAHGEEPNANAASPSEAESAAGESNDASSVVVRADSVGSSAGKRSPAPASLSEDG